MILPAVFRREYCFPKRNYLTPGWGCARALEPLKSWPQVFKEFDEARIFPKFVEVWIAFEPGKVWVTIFCRICQPFHGRIRFIHQRVGRGNHMTGMMKMSKALADLDCLIDLLLGRASYHHPRRKTQLAWTPEYRRSSLYFALASSIELWLHQFDLRRRERWQYYIRSRIAPAPLDLPPLW